MYVGYTIISGMSQSKFADSLNAMESVLKEILGALDQIQRASSSHGKLQEQMLG